MDGLIGGHITLDHMYGRMQEHDLARTNWVWSLWIVNCLVSSLAIQRWLAVQRLNVDQETWDTEICMGHSRRKRLHSTWNIRDNKSHWPAHVSPPFSRFSAAHPAMKQSVHFIQCVCSLHYIFFQPICPRFQSPVTVYRINRILTAHAASLSLG